MLPLDGVLGLDDDGGGGNTGAMCLRRGESSKSSPQFSVVDREWGVIDTPGTAGQGIPDGVLLVPEDRHGRVVGGVVVVPV